MPLILLVDTEKNSEIQKIMTSGYVYRSFINLRVRLSLGGNSIAHRKQMLLFFELAKASYLNPEKNLEDLKLEIQSRIQINKYYLPRFYWELTKSLIHLGHYVDALKTFKSTAMALTRL